MVSSACRAYFHLLRESRNGSCSGPCVNPQITVASCYLSYFHSLRTGGKVRRLRDETSGLCNVEGSGGLVLWGSGFRV